jgi:hypothetical protein
MDVCSFFTLIIGQRVVISPSSHALIVNFGEFNLLIIDVF